MKTSSRWNASRLSFILLLLAILLFCSFPHATQAQETESVLKRVKWQRGPSDASLGNIAQVQVPPGYVFADANDTKLLMEDMHNPLSGEERGFLAPDTLEWFIVFEFSEVGYVKDDEKHSLDADAIFKAIKSGNEKTNEVRRKRGWPALNVVDWEQKPHYDSETHNLEWAVRFESEGRLVINYNTRLLGRNGIMRVTLVAEPSILSETVPKFKTVMNAFAFQQGYKYTEFRKGDKIAQYGLTGLIVGGATAVAVKTGAFKWLWKVGVAILVGAGALLRKFFRRKEV